MDKAYKILAAREKISNREAKSLLDSGRVQSNGKKVRASDVISEKLPLKILALDSCEILFQNDEILALNKPSAIDCAHLEREFGGFKLLHRLDKPTSGVILLAREGSEFQKAALNAFKNELVYKEYLALVGGIVAESRIIELPILTEKNHFAKSKIDVKHGRRAISEITPLQILGKKTLLKVVIKTGRTHQIRVHLSAINHAIYGDSSYGGREFPRLMLHAHKIALLGREFCANRGNFWTFLRD